MDFAALKSAYKDLKNVALGVGEIEAKVLENTSNDPWGPHGTAMSELARASHDVESAAIIFGTLRRRMEDEGKDWRHVYKSMAILEFLVGHGSEMALREVKRMASELRRLERFAYVEPGGKDQGLNVRHKAMSLQKLLADPQAIKDARAKARQNQGKYTGISSAEERGRGSSGGGGGGGGGFGNSGSKYGGFSSSDYFREEPRSGYDHPPAARRKGAESAGGGAPRAAASAADDDDDDGGWEAFGADEVSGGGRAGGSVPKIKLSAAPPARAAAVAPAPRLSAPSAAPALPRPAPAPQAASNGGFDAFDPRGTSAAPAAAPTPPPDVDFFGLDSAPAPMPVPAPAATGGVEDLFGDFSAAAPAPALAPAPIPATAFAAAAPAVDLFGQFQAPPAMPAPAAAATPSQPVDPFGFGNFVATPAPPPLQPHMGSGMHMGGLQAAPPTFPPAMMPQAPLGAAMTPLAPAGVAGGALSMDFFSPPLMGQQGIASTGNAPMAMPNAIGSVGQNPEARKVVSSGGLGDMLSSGLVDLSLDGGKNKAPTGSSMGASMMSGSAMKHNSGFF